MGWFYKATIQAVLLYGAETWTLTQPLQRLLDSFHHRCARYLSRMTNTQQPDGTWLIPPSATALANAGLHPISTYIRRHVDTILPFIQTRAILWECRTSQPTQAAANHPIWWAHLPALCLPARPADANSTQQPHQDDPSIQAIQTPALTAAPRRSPR